jgi:hypothetical protein
MKTDELATKTLKAVDALLTAIIENPTAQVGVNTAVADGTRASYSAQAIKTLLETPLIKDAVALHLQNQDMK